ncbi:hypothetical protein C8R44DRAFT_741366 [Mycena epipterygia]|nr:hypothetical protein C8R44DRAFT_741366 [Mycena epipterygia]
MALELLPQYTYLTTFIVPALHRLQVPDNALRPDPIDQLNSFISQSGCLLQEVYITGERLLSRSLYRTAFLSIPNFSFNREPDHWAIEQTPDDDESEVGSDDEQLKESDEESNPNS